MLKNRARKCIVTAGLAAALSLLMLWAAIAGPAVGAVQDSPVISDIRITNVTDKSFSISWLTDVAADGQVNYGTTPALGSTRGHDANIGTSTYVHHVTIGGLPPNTTYYFDVVSDGSVDDDGGAHHQFTTGPTLSVPPVDYVFGTVYQQDGTTPVQGAVVYVTVVDRDGSWSAGASATLSAVTDSAGVWFVNLASVRTADYSAFFNYANADELQVQVQAAPIGMAALVIDVGQTNDASGNPVACPDLILTPSGPDIQVTPTAVEVTLPEGQSTTVPLTIANVGDATLTFTITKSVISNQLSVISSQPSLITDHWSLVTDHFKVDPALLDALDAAPDGRATFFVYLEEQAGLSAAYAIKDWKARGEYVYRTLRETAQRSQKELLADLQTRKLAGDVTRIRSFFIINAVAVTGGRSTVDALAARPEVAYLAPEPVYHISEPLDEKDAPAAPASVEWNIARIGADRAWSDLGVTGEGVVVASIDTGVEYTHTALMNQYRGTATGSHDYNWYDPTGTYPDAPGDNLNYGTHVMGVMVGDDGAGNQIGVAPGAQWIAAKGCAGRGCNSSDLLAAAEWMLAPCPIGVEPDAPTCDPAKRPHVISNSWGGGGGDTWFESAVYAWRAAGIFFAFPAGNSGPGDGTVGSPADYAVGFATGATDQAAVICWFSSRGPSSLTPETKPDVVAPGCGEGIRSALAGGGYGTKNGTGMANAHTAGVVALLRAANPALTVEELETLLVNKAVDLGPTGPDYTYGYGRIDAYAAVQAANDPAFWLSPTPMSGSVEPGSQTVISVTLNAAGLSSGPHAARLLITSDDPDEPTATVPVTMTVIPGQLKIANIRVSGIRDVSATVSWITVLTATGQVYYGTDPANLTSVAYDDRGAGVRDSVHHVTITGLSPNTTYYFYVVSDGAMDDNDGQYHQFTTGAPLSVPGSDSVYGQVFKSDGVTPAADVLVYLRVLDNDASGSPGRSGLLSGMTDSNGYWIDLWTGGPINLRAARTEDGQSYFDYSPSGDRLPIEVWAGNGCHTTVETDTNNDSPASPITLSCPAPTLASLSPSSATVGSPAFTLTVNGTDFIIGSVVQWNGSDRPTTFYTSTLLTAEITAADIAAAGTVTVTVFSPPPEGGTSNVLTFAITDLGNPVPVITSLGPDSATAGGGAFTLTVNGTDFVNDSVVRWNGSDRATTFVSSTQLRAEITAADIVTAGTASVTVFNPAPGGGASNAKTFTINNPMPAITSLSPSSATAGGGAFTLTVNGTDFVNDSVVRWNGSDRATTFVSSTQLRAEITATDIATAGTASVTVFNPEPGGGTSDPQTFTINPPPGGDPYEPDDTCASANAIPPSGDFQEHNFHTPGDADWLRFNAIADTDYIVSTLHVGDDAHAIIRLYDECEADPFDVSDTFGYDQIITFRAEQDGLYYIKLAHLDPSAHGDDTAYRVSVRPVTTGAAIIVGGRLRASEEFQQQITFMTNRTYQIFHQAGYDHGDIYYMSADPNPPLHMDAPSRPANLSYAIQTWAPNQLEDGEPLYLYLADHGENEYFFLDTGAHKVTPDELDTWLLAFEVQRPNSPVVLIMEACRSGSFITPLGTISRPGRVIVTAAGENTDAYVKPPGQGGAYFSDAFFNALAQNYDVWQSYEIGRQAVGDRWGGLQTPWVDGNGNGVPYPDDGDDEGAGRSLGLGRPAALSGGQAPFIETPALPPLGEDNRMLIQVKVLDENPAGMGVWVEVTKPSTPAPSAPPGYITPVSHAELVEMAYNGTSGRFEVEFEFDEAGEYQFVFNAEDGGGQRAQAVGVSMVRDVTGDGVIDVEDVQKVAGCWRQPVTEPGCGVADINNDAVINIVDVMLVVRGWTSAQASD